jgi:PAS domain S-box-containing protein
MKKAKISISTISVISLLLLTSVVFCFFGYVYYNRQKNAHLSELHSTLETTTQQLAKGLSIAIWNFDEAQIIEILKSGLLDQNIDHITIEYNDKNKTTRSITRDQVSHFKITKKRILPSPDALMVESDVTYISEYVGKLTIYGTTKFVYEKLQTEVTVIALFILLLIIIIIAGVYCIFYFIVIKPLQYLEQFSFSVSKNFDLKQLDEKKFFKELDHLNHSLKEMLRSLNSSYKKVEESEKKYKEIANLLPLTIFEFDLEGGLRYINEMGLNSLGITRDDLEKDFSVTDMIAPENIPDFHENISLLLSGRKPLNGNEYEIIRKDGSSFPSLVYSSLVLENNVAVAIRGVGIDLTEQKKNEAAFNALIQLNFIKEKESEKLRILSLIEGQEKERLRISKEIHDGVGQMLAAVRLSSESINPTSITSEKDLEKLEYTKSLIQETIIELRQVSSDLSPTFLYDYGLYSATNQLVITISKVSDLAIRLNSNIQKQRFRSLVEVTLYRIIQEAINNTLKYSHAKNLKINLMVDAEFLEVLVADDGVGYNLSSQEETNGNGIKNMYSRANLIGANLNIQSSPGKGFQISIQIPLDNTTR